MLNIASGMAGVDTMCSEMRDIELQPADLWEEHYSKYELFIQTKRYPIRSHYHEIASVIRGTYVLIIQHLNTYHWFAGTPEAVNLTYNSLDVLDNLRKAHPNDEQYLEELFIVIKDIVMEVHNACFVTHNYDSISSENQAKRRKVTNTSKQLTNDGVAPPVKTSNKFQVLSNVTQEDGAVPSSSKVTEVPQLSMDTNETTEATVTERTAVKKDPRPPPITIIGHNNIFAVNKHLKSLIKGDLKAVNTKDGMRYYTTNIEDHRIIKKFLDEEKKEYYTFQLKNERPIRVVLKRLPVNVNPDDIKEELTALGFPVRSVKQITKTENNQIIKLPTFPIELDNTEKAKEIYDLNRLLYTVVSVESYRPRAGLKQCFRCQRFNHTFVGCNLSPRCVICSGNHGHKECPVKNEAKDDKNKLKCVNCGEVGHPASFRGCRVYKEALDQFNKPKNDSKNKTTLGRTFTSKKVNQGISYSSAVTPTATETQKAPAQSRLQTAVTRSRMNQMMNSSNVEQMITSISPMISSLNNPLEKFMLMSKIVEMCFCDNV